MFNTNSNIKETLSNINRGKKERFKMQDLITVIVPIYQVEKYLKKCLDSILNQTYKNLEIILVDDGSKDNSPQICEEYKTKDSRIKVIHKENGGLSDARNAGLKIATGKYIGFVDSDDYIKSDMYQILYENIIKAKADISICDVLMVKENANISDSLEDNCLVKELNFYEALKLLVENKIKSYAWNKLYKKEIFENIQFPKGRKMEDLAIMYKVFEKASKVVFTSKKEYYYLQRNDSILGNIDLKLTKDLWYFVTERYNYIIKKYPKLEESLDINRLNYILIYHKNICLLNEKREFNEEWLLKEYNFLKENHKRYKNSIYNEMKHSMKLEYKLLHNNRTLFWNYYQLKRKIKNIVK